MNKPEKSIAIPDEVVMSKIYVIRDQKVMLDRDLAELYGVETKVLKQAVKRNQNRFPTDFMFEMTPQELEQWRTEFASPEDKYVFYYVDKKLSYGTKKNRKQEHPQSDQSIRGYQLWGYHPHGVYQKTWLEIKTETRGQALPGSDHYQGLEEIEWKQKKS